MRRLLALTWALALGCGGAGEPATGPAGAAPAGGKADDPSESWRPDRKTLPIGLGPSERAVRGRRATPSPPPVGPVQALGEWEQSDGVMTLWHNASLVRSLSARGNVRILADDDRSQQWWIDWLDGRSIARDRIDFWLVPTNSIWVRDYGPWFVVDGRGDLGIVDTTYNRPRPLDDLVPVFVGRTLGVPVYSPALVHTGGNIYADGLGNALSSTLPYEENDLLTHEEIGGRLQRFLGIDRYTTNRLNSSIEHIDTWGKLVAPDTVIWSEFPEDSEHRQNSEEMVVKLAALESPYGSPYKVLRLKMFPNGDWDGYHAYLNSFISNGALYFPTYGVPSDDEARRVYQAALPGYEIVGVDAEDTEWGDSVHCRTRNVMTRDTVFVFPRVSAEPGRVEVTARVVPSPGATLSAAPTMHYRVDGGAEETAALPPDHEDVHRAVLSLPAGAKVALWIEATDSIPEAGTSGRPSRRP